MTELAGLKKPNVLMFNKKNEIVPFDDPSSLEFFAAKNDASLFVIGSTQKKRKDNLVWVRTFDGQVMDMLEMGVLEEKAMREFKGVSDGQIDLRTSSAIDFSQRPSNLVSATDLSSISQAHNSRLMNLSTPPESPSTQPSLPLPI